LLFTLRVADEALEAAQLSLLEIVTKIAVTEIEMERLKPLAETGAIVGRRKLEMDYQLKQLLSEQSARIQELKLRGLSAQQIQNIIDDRELISEVEIRLDSHWIAERFDEKAMAFLRLTSVEGGDSGNWSVVPTPDFDGPIYTVEHLDVFPGRLVGKGEQLAHVANHHELFLRGDAFDSDVVAIRNALTQNWDVTAEMGLGESRVQVRNLKITYLDNHVDATTQTYPFFLALPNRVVGERRDAKGRLFRSWQFKPGQRAHLYVPTEVWMDQIVLPRDSVVRSGPESYVFRLAAGSAFQRRLAPNERLARLERMNAWTLEPVPVQVLHKDRREAVVTSDGDLKVGDLVVVERAYQVYLAWKLQMAGGGGGHDHPH
jgi:membrane fusion protein, heavy metal efflux system